MLIVGRALGDGDRADLGGEVDVGAGRVHRRELDVVGVGAGQRHGRLRLSLDVLARGLELVLDVDVGGRDEGVDAGALGVLDRVPGRVDVGLVGAREAADHGALDLAGDRLDGLEVAGRGDREAGLDHVDAEAGELLRDLDLLLRVQGDARRLLAVAQRRIEDVDPVLLGYLGCFAHDFPPSLETCDDLFVGSRLSRRQRLFPPKGEEKEKRQAVEPVSHSLRAG